jgi:hypothetical protein
VQRARPFGQVFQVFEWKDWPSQTKRWKCENSRLRISTSSAAGEVQDIRAAGGSGRSYEDIAPRVMSQSACKLTGPTVAWAICQSKVATDAGLTMTPRSTSSLGIAFVMSSAVKRIILNVPTRFIVAASSKARACGCPLARRRAGHTRCRRS